MADGDLRGIGVGKSAESRNIADLSVVVVGGLVMDVFVRTDDLPTWGKAIQAQSLALQPGGKGFNQAIAAKRLGARVSVVSAVGQDHFSELVLDQLAKAGIDTAGVHVSPGATSPVTIVLSRPGGETSFVGWKNAASVRLEREHVKSQSRLIQDADIVLTTLELDPVGVGEALDIAAKAGCMTVLNPAPPLEGPRHNPTDLPLSRIDYLVPNEWEAREFAGRGGAASKSVKEVATFIVNTLGVRNVCITRAHDGCVIYGKSRSYREYAAYETTAHDTTGASDAFCATLALHLKAGYETEDAIHQAQAAGAWAVTKEGAGLMPSLEQLEAHRKFLEDTRRH